jgi:hypothetical protein
MMVGGTVANQQEFFGVGANQGWDLRARRIERGGGLERDEEWVWVMGMVGHVGGTGNRQGEEGG